MALFETRESGHIIGLKIGLNSPHSPPPFHNTHSIEIGGNVMRQ